MTLNKVLNKIQKNVKKTLKKKNLNRYLVGVMAVSAILISLQADPSSTPANLSASLVESMPTGMIQEFKQGEGIQVIQAQAAPTRKPLPKQEPKIKFSNSMWVTASGYNSLPGQGWGDVTRTATGMTTRWGIVAAADPRLPYGTQFMIRSHFGDTIFEVQDTGGGGAGWIDIWFAEYNEAIQWGRRQIQIDIIAS